MAAGKVAVSFEYQCWITLRELASHQVTQSVALKAGKGEQLQVTLFGKWLYGLTIFFFLLLINYRKKNLL